jgi:transcriptional regulator of acetoin/glycerol metabolism
VRSAFERFRSGEAIAPSLVERTIAHSRKRCVDFGLEERPKPDFDGLSLRRLGEAHEQHRALTLQALPVMENLYQQIVDTESMILLTDPRGLILHSIRDDGFLPRAEKVALRPGVLWSEKEKGTNAIVTAIVTEAPALVHGAEHFLTANHFLTCSATPIADPYGQLIGVLDVTGDWRGYHRHAMALVRMSASVIENNLVDGAFADEITLHFHARAELIGALFQGIAVFRTGTFVTANRSALFQLGTELAALHGRSFAELFGVPLPAVLNQLAVRADRPVSLSLQSGVRVMGGRATARAPRGPRSAVRAERHARRARNRRPPGRARDRPGAPRARPRHPNPAIDATCCRATAGGKAASHGLAQLRSPDRSARAGAAAKPL